MLPNRKTKNKIKNAPPAVEFISAITPAKIARRKIIIVWNKKKNQYSAFCARPLNFAYFFKASKK